MKLEMTEEGVRIEMLGGTEETCKLGRDWIAMSARIKELDAMLDARVNELAGSQCFIDEYRQVKNRMVALETAIKTHRAQKADDRCIEDDDVLYAAVGDGIPCDRRVGDKTEMLANCERFIERRCQSGRWPSYQELERRLARIQEIVDRPISGETLITARAKHEDIKAALKGTT